jgi:hypothetical protein
MEGNREPVVVRLPLYAIVGPLRILTESIVEDEESGTAVARVSLLFVNGERLVRALKAPPGINRGDGFLKTVAADALRNLSRPGTSAQLYSSVPPKLYFCIRYLNDLKLMPSSSAAFFLAPFVSSRATRR